MTKSNSEQKPYGWDRFVSDNPPKSDRSAAILGAVYMDVCLGNIIGNFLVDDYKEAEKLLSEEKPLGNFITRARTAYCLGLISPDEYHDLNLVIAIRNFFYYQSELIDFSSEGVREKCKSFKLTRSMLLPKEDPTTRSLYTFTCTLLAQHLALRAEIASQERRRTPEEFVLVDSDEDKT